MGESPWKFESSWPHHFLLHRSSAKLVPPSVDDRMSRFAQCRVKPQADDVQHYFGDNAPATGIDAAPVVPAQAGAYRACRSRQTHVMAPARAGATVVFAEWVGLGDGATVAGILPKFTNIYPKRGISVNLPRLCEVGLPGPKAGLGFNTFKEPVAQQMPE